MSARWVSHQFSKHMHDVYTVGLNYDGHGAFECRGEVHDAAPRTCNLLAPGELHTGQALSSRGWIYRNLYIETGLLHEFLSGLEQYRPLAPQFKASLTKDPVLCERLARVFASLERPAFRLQHESLLISVIARLVTDHLGKPCSLRKTGRENIAVQRVKNVLHEHPALNVSLKELANQVGLSPHYLVRAFHLQVGVPPHRYQTIVRVNLARSFLRRGTPISEVAHQTGFYDQSHLNRCFKKVCGVTPGAYVAALNS